MVGGERERERNEVGRAGQAEELVLEPFESLAQGRRLDHLHLELRSQFLVLVLECEDARRRAGRLDRLGALRASRRRIEGFQGGSRAVGLPAFRRQLLLELGDPLLEQLRVLLLAIPRSLGGV